MAPIYTPVSSIVAGKIKLKLRVRVILLWSVTDYKNPQEESFVHMLLLDEKNGKIQATAKKNLIPKAKSLVQEGLTYEVEKFYLSICICNLNRIEGVDVQVTQGVSQTSTALSVPLPEDMLQTRRMTIEDLIEAFEECNGVVLATICDIETEFSWYYEACTKCVGRVKIIVGRMFCPRCKQSRNAVPRYKVHVQVIDHTRSTSFILFDRNVQNYVGGSVQDLIDRQNQGNNNAKFPREMDIFMGKTMMFKIEITNGNLLHNWRNYTVKRSSDDIDLIKCFKIFHNIKESFDEDQAADVLENLITLSDVAPAEAGDSTKSDKNMKEQEDTPCSKLNAKRAAENIPQGPTFETEDGEGSANKAKTKIACIKTEKD